MEKQKQQPQRLQSLDALRGFDMLFIMGGASLFVALATLFPNPFFQAIAGQMEHVEWSRDRDRSWKDRLPCADPYDAGS